MVETSSKANQNHSILDTILNSIQCFPLLPSGQLGVATGACPNELGTAEERDESSRLNITLGATGDPESPSRWTNSQESHFDRALNFASFPAKTCSPNIANAPHTPEPEAAMWLDRATLSLGERTTKAPCNGNSQRQIQGTSQSIVETAIPSSGPFDAVKSPSRSCHQGMYDRTTGVISSTAYHVSETADCALNGLTACGVEIPAKLEETALRPPHSSSARKEERTTSMAAKDVRLPPLPDIVRNNSLVEFPPPVARMAPLEITQLQPNPPKQSASASSARRLPKDGRKAPTTKGGNTGASRHQGLKAPATRRANRCSSPPTAGATSTIPAAPKMKGKPSAGISNTNRNSAAGQNRFVLPPSRKKLLPDSTAKTVKVSNVRGSDQRKEKEARSDCMELVLTSSLEGVAFVKRRSSFKKNSNRGNNPTKSKAISSIRRSPSRSRLFLP